MKNNYALISGEVQLTQFNEISALRKQVWPNFIRVPDEKILKLYKNFPNFQFSLRDEKTNKLIAIFNTIPLRWEKSLMELPEEGVSWAIQTGLNGNGDVSTATVLCATSMTVSPDYRNQGLSKVFLNHAKKIAQENKFTSIIAAVRPNLKCQYPLITMEEYVTWQKPDGSCFDPWLRVHAMLGAVTLNVCKQSASVTATIEEWESWTGVNFPSDGDYVIKEALAPLHINHARNIGTYVEPNVWVYYPLSYF